MIEGIVSFAVEKEVEIMRTSSCSLGFSIIIKVHTI